MSASPEPHSEPGARLGEGREAEVFAWSEGEVLRLYRDPHAGDRADREIAALRAVRSAASWVPEPYRRFDWQGRPGILMQRLDGHGILAEVERRPWRLLELAKLCGRLHSELNRLPAPAELPDLTDALASRLDGAPEVPSELGALARSELARLPRGDALCHGDFQPDNVLLCESGPAVIDWAGATRGNAASDFARTALMMKIGALPPGAPALDRIAGRAGRALFARIYTSEYGRTMRHDPDEVRRWMFVRTVDRLTEGITEERKALLQTAHRLRPHSLHAHPPHAHPPHAHR